MLQYKYETKDEFGCWDFEIISADAGTRFTSTDFLNMISAHS